jgi:hypothetical protein
VQGIDGSGAGLSQEMLELGEDLLDRIEVWAIGRQVDEVGATGFDGLLDAGDLVAAEIVENDDVAGFERRRQRLFDPLKARRSSIRSLKETPPGGGGGAVNAAPLIGPSNTQGAVIRSCRNAATKVVVLQCPCGAMPSTRCPLGPRP